MFFEKDLAQIEERGSNLSEVELQIKNFQTGFPFLKVVKAATIGDGIIKLNQSQIEHFSRLYETNLPNKKVVKFVPASGAASRMFKSLFSFMESYKGTDEDQAKLESDQGFQSVFNFFQRIEDFAFFDELQEALKDHGSISELIEQKKHALIVEYLLTEKGLDYGSLPKGLLAFHSYGDTSRTPALEHLVEAANYGTTKGGKAYLHLTVSPEHRQKFTSHINAKKTSIEDHFGVSIDVSYSEQKPSTDTIAVDLENQPFRESDGTILFRPGGHGALIENLNEIDADIVFIKNIDNVVPDKIKGITYTYKKALAGVLLDFQHKIFHYLSVLENNQDVDLAEIESFLEKEICLLPPSGYSSYSKTEKVSYLKNKLNRPIRICGMVKNEGEPGGGPFWAENNDGSVSLQIAESAQIDQNDPTQNSLMQNATHFNPVDLICSFKDQNGNAFNLLKYRDPQTGFISGKSKDGKELKAQELPGLWNGAMSDWNTIFVEVPIETFNPVKTVNDLLREQHQN
ncbi:MAG: DUF4301 family protein [Bacteroidetes bacterium]|nr:DUF4301 family protein [Bacteroidota bacterium]